jgi:hypothetical protein
MAIDATFTVNGNAVSGAMAVAAGSAVTLAVSNTSGINLVSWSVVGTDRASHASPTITASGSPPGASASFTMPADAGDGLGQGYIIQAIATDGGSPAQTSTFSAVIGVASANGIVPIAADEESERGTHGWIEAINSLMSGAEPRVSGIATTTDATTTTVHSVSFTLGKIYRMNIRWVGRRTDGLQVAARESQVWVDNLSGTPAQLGATVDLLASAKTDATWGAMDFVIGPTMAIRIAGKASTNINWYVSYSLQTY